MSTTPTAFSRFLELPGELRNQIYEAAAALISCIEISSHGETSQPSLAFVSRQVRDEFLSVWATSKFESKQIDADVVDFNFGHLIPFMKRTRHNPSKPFRPNVKLIFTRPAHDSSEALDTWLDYCRTVQRRHYQCCAYYHAEQDLEAWGLRGGLRFITRHLTRDPSVDVGEASFEAASIGMALIRCEQGARYLRWVVHG